MVSAPASGQGKTTLVAALARMHRDQGRKVRVFKIGPDFIDPSFLTQASGRMALQLDPFMVGEATCRQLLWEAAADADLILIEARMGFYDGAPSSAEIARRLNLPVMLVMDASGMAQTFAALIGGLVNFAPDLNYYGVVGNRLLHKAQARVLERALESLPVNILWRGYLPRDEQIQLPEAILDQADSEDVDTLDQHIQHASELLDNPLLKALPPVVAYEAPESLTDVPVAGKPLAGVRIGIARDRAFRYLFPANLQLLQTLGATLYSFSPLRDEHLPDVDSLYLPGGTPEQYMDELADNRSLIAEIRHHFAYEKPILAEGGAVNWLASLIVDRSGHSQPMCRLLSAEVESLSCAAAFSAQQIEWPVDDRIEALPRYDIRGYAYSQTRLNTDLKPLTRGISPFGGTTQAPIYRVDRLIASRIHLYFPSNPELIVQLLSPAK